MSRTIKIASEWLKINDVLLARVSKTKNQKLELKIDLISSFSRYFSIAGNSHFFKCKDLDEFKIDTFENANQICKNNSGFENLFDNVPNLNEKIRHSSSWRPVDFEFNANYQKFLLGQKTRTGFDHLNKFHIFEKYIQDIWTGYKRVNTSHFGLGNHFIELDAFDPKFKVSQFGKVLYNFHSCT